LDALGGLVLGCASDHRFDANRRGYLTTLDASRGISGDTRAILEARARFLALGHYSPIVDAVVASLPDHRALSVLDAGTGTGYYLDEVLSRTGSADALALDASAAAVGMSVAATGAAGLVADTWQPLAVRDHRADVILCIFAPRNAAEFARVLRPDGLLVVVSPAPGHLAELRAAGLVIGLQADKSARLEEALRGHFSPAGSLPVRYALELTAAESSLLADMGPSGHHRLSGPAAGYAGTVTVDVVVSTWRGPAAGA
jgi:23S rRNA (guanine745-N1)-methyltransferase